MKTYSIMVQSSGADLGVYAADNEEGAVEAMARDAGYASFAQACAIYETEDPDAEIERARDDLRVVRVKYA